MILKSENEAKENVNRINNKYRGKKVMYYNDKYKVNGADFEENAVGEFIVFIEMSLLRNRKETRIPSEYEVDEFERKARIII